MVLLVVCRDSLRIASGNQPHGDGAAVRRAWKPGESAYLGGGFNLRGAAHPRGLQLSPLGNELQIPTTKLERRSPTDPDDLTLIEEDEADNESVVER